MTEPRILDAALLKDLLNHIYEKRKATAFQIEGLTKAALANKDSPLIYKIIAELTELANEGSTSGKMGAITALGSVSVALGSLTIAYFLEQIVRPIFAVFRDTDARVRYYACESLYNIAKVARGEILLYFNEVFDILCILVTDTESSVKNAADILDRLIKDIVSAKSSSYVSMLHQQNEESHDIQSHIITPDGLSVQVNNVQDPLKAFLLPRFIPTLLERMYTIEPFAKKFLLSWLELFDDIPSSELITFLPNFLNPLLRFFMNGCPSDVRIETQNLLNIFLKEIKAIYKVKYEVRRLQIIKDRRKKIDEEAIKSKREVNTDGVEINPEASEELGENLDRLSILQNQRTDHDSISIKSNSTTIIRKADPLKVGADPEISFSSNELDDNSLFVNGQDIFIDFPRIIDILLSFLRPPTVGSNIQEFKANDLAGESHDVYLEIQSIALRWLHEIILISPTSFSKYLPDCVSIIMQNVSFTDDHNDIELRNQFLSFSDSLRTYLILLHANQSEDPNLISFLGTSESAINEVSESFIQGLNKESYDEFLEFYLMKTIEVVMNECLLSINELARLTSLEWLTFLYSNYRSSFFPQDLSSDSTMPTNKQFSLDLTALLKSSVDASNDVVLKVLKLVAQISEDNHEFFKDFMIKLVSFFETDGPDLGKLPTAYQNSATNGGQAILSRSKVEFIIRRLCVSISSERIFESLSEVLVSYENSNLEFLSNIVVTFNNILLTTAELQSFRKKLKSIDICKAEDWALFSTLFKSWCHNTPSVLSLCLLTSNYELAYLIIKCLAELEVTFQLLAQLDVLVQLLESHIFLKLRLQLLEPEKHPYLYKTLYGILMIMPQSSTYTTLRNRLTSLTLFTQNSGIQQHTPSISTPVTTPSAIGAGSSTMGLQLSTRKKRIHEMVDKFAKISELHEIANFEQKSPEGLDDASTHGRSSNKTEEVIKRKIQSRSTQNLK
ncbi:ARM repeat-containing protein [Metschnikowia bicuspidata var. bicuspidata NRRL YB-4993]|uniref:ARM repeat-containing protein n=1 Tax=Metschnikowia bicuspidata var. bicuspidata NRRL YB-4993 TaxID=869754 RepID=A0A1A0H7P2_9ASCO|nr:ARM repeat-containing protein [Metschnikowia bicuspidata var. bicuspidata NRRL YB-4993]OBA19918.1 ARM repeat-containing protein [Metschnikowia bicuspidata var. bicuspidata NRRL YB-4993]